METFNNGNHDGENQDTNNLENNKLNDSSRLKNGQEKRDDSDDFHKYDNLSHSQDGERLESQDGERIDKSGTDPNRYANLASQDTGSSKSMYNDEERQNLKSNTPDEDFDEDDAYDAEDVSDEAYSDEEEELQDNEANRFKSSSESVQKSTSPDEPFFTEGI